MFNLLNRHAEEFWHPTAQVADYILAGLAIEILKQVQHDIVVGQGSFINLNSKIRN